MKITSISDKVLYWTIHILILGVPLSFYINMENPFTPVKWTLFRAVLFIMIAAWLIGKIWKEEFVFYKLKSFIPLIIFIFFCTLSHIQTFLTGMSYVSAGPFYNQISMIVFFYISFDYCVNNFSESHLRTVMISFFLVAFYGVIQHFGLDLFRWEQSSPHFESISTIGNSNLLGLFLNLSLPFTVVYGISRASAAEKCFFALSALLTLSALYFTYSRGAILALIISLPLWFFILKGEKKIRLNKKSAAVFLVIFAVLLSVIVFYGDTVCREAVKFSDLSSIRVRVFLWKAAFRIIRDNPLIGTGFDTYSYYYLPYRYDEPFLNRNRLAYAENSHNDFLDMAVSAGLFSLFAFLSFLFLIIYGAFLNFSRLFQEEKIIMKASLLSVFLYLININTVFSEISSQLFFWYFLSVILSLQIKNTSSFPSITCSSGFFKKFPRMKAVFLIFIIVLTFVFQWRNLYPLRANYLLHSGQEAKDRGDWEEAIKYTSDALSFEPYNWKYWVAMAKTCEGALEVTSSKKELIDTAIMSYNNAIELNPLHSYTYADLGRLYSIQSSILGREYLEKSIEEYEKAAMLDPYNVILINDLGTTYLLKGDYDEAISCYERSIEILPEGHTYSKLGKALMDRGDLAGSENALNKAVELDPKLGEAYFYLAYLYSYEDKKSRAFTMIDKAFYLEPENPVTGQLWLEIARALQEND